MLYKISLRPNAQSHPVLIEMTIFIIKTQTILNETKLKRCHFDEQAGNAGGVRRNLIRAVYIKHTEQDLFFPYMPSRIEAPILKLKSFWVQMNKCIFEAC